MIVDTVENRIQNAIWTAGDNIMAPNIEVAVRSISRSSGRDATSDTTNSESAERIMIAALLESVFKSTNTSHVSNTNYEPPKIIPE